MRLREVAAIVAAPPRLRRRREEQTRKATRCLSDHSAYQVVTTLAKMMTQKQRYIKSEAK